jgi:hypothetical protein
MPIPQTKPYVTETSLADARAIAQIAFETAQAAALAAATAADAAIDVAEHLERIANAKQLQLLSML